MKAAVIRYKLVACRLAQTCLDASLGDASRNTMQWFSYAELVKVMLHLRVTNVCICRFRTSNNLWQIINYDFGDVSYY